MNKRILVVCRNIGFEGTDQGLWSVGLPFADQVKLDEATRMLAAGLKNPLDQAVILTNELGNQLGFNPHLYAYHFVQDIEESGDWPEAKPWTALLPPDGEPPPTRESL